jgi:hypothetical protein
VWGTTSAVDLEATSPKDLGGWRFLVPLEPSTERAVEWKLAPANHIAGKLLALDGKTPLGNVVVELVKPEEDRQSRREESRTESQKAEVRSQKPSQSLVTSAATNRVLSLPRDGNYAMRRPIFSAISPKLWRVGTTRRRLRGIQRFHLRRGATSSIDGSSFHNRNQGSHRRIRVFP